MRTAASAHSVVGMNSNESRTAVITGASAGLGRALAERLAAEGWRLVLTARGEDRLAETAGRLGAAHLAGDVVDPAHRERLVALSEGRIDLLVNNASTLGQTPLPELKEADLSVWPRLFDVNVRAPLALAQLALPSLRRHGGAIVNITSDAATGPYATWGPYGATKAALDQLSNVLAAEEPEIAVWAVDPGEMHTRMLTEAVGEADAWQAPPPERSAEAIARIVAARPESGRIEARSFAAVTR